LLAAAVWEMRGGRKVARGFIAGEAATLKRWQLIGLSDGR
jgi:hypothetical protein